MWTLPLGAVLPFVLAAGVQVPASTLGNECATCHLRGAWTKSVLTHVDLWITSQHALYRVGCEKCHGGDAATSDQRAAHRGVVNSSNPSSPVHRRSLPEMCGRCHRAETGAFALSAHRELLSRGNPSVPTCTSCHVSMATEAPSPAELEAQCLSCHRDDPQDRARVARRQVEEVTKLRIEVRRAKRDVDLTKDGDRKASLTRQWAACDQALRDVTASVHAFDQRRVEEQLRDVRVRIDQLRAEVARR